MNALLKLQFIPERNTYDRVVFFNLKRGPCEIYLIAIKMGIWHTSLFGKNIFT